LRLLRCSTNVAISNRSEREREKERERERERERGGHMRRILNRA
jgi:hypothetical protein